MNPITLQLRHCAEPIREPSAWFIPGADVTLWLKEICRWGMPQSNLRLFVLPNSAAERLAAGLFIVPPDGAKPACVPRALPFGNVTEGLYIPIDAELWPPVSPEELRRNLRKEALASETDQTQPTSAATELLVFHPSIGLVGFEAGDVLSVADFLRAPPSRVENWNFAKPGIGLNERLLSVELIAPMSLQQMFGDAPNEIGSEPIEGLPASPDERSSNPAARLVDEATRRFAEALHKFLKRLPHTGTRRTWVNDLEDWAAQKFQKLARDLEKSRNREINRLLDELENDPDRGLRHAIPMSGLGHRGIAPPGDRLGSRTPDFNLDQLRGGGPADIWNLGADVQMKLIARYRELANRELQLGRYRRAAYIFAQLLGDLSSAAAALKQGRHFREAATIYKDYLRQPITAAECLAEGGLFAEAVALYEEHSFFVQAGDLYKRIGHPDKAAETYNRAVQNMLDARDRLGAARLVEEKLEDPERALVILNAAWPNSPQAGKCLDAQLEMMSRKGWHDRAATLIERLHADCSQKDILTITTVITSHSSKYPDRAVRHAMADLVRVKASTRLDSAPPAELLVLADALAQLAPGDKLLGRDAVRFRTFRAEQQQNRKTLPPPIRKTGGPIMVRAFKLPPGITWRSVKSCGGCFFALGYSENKVWLLRGDWEGEFQTLHWDSTYSLPPIWSFEVDTETSRPPEVILLPGPAPVRYDRMAFAAADRFAGVVRAGTPHWLPADTVVAATHGSILWLVRLADTPVLETRTLALDGQLLSSSVLREPLTVDQGAINRWEMAVQRELLWFSAHQSLALYQRGALTATWQAETPIRFLVPSSPNLPLCLAAVMHKGVSLHWADNLKPDTETLCAELLSPLAGFTANGTLILVASNQGRICDVAPDRVRSITEFTFPIPPLDPIALIRAEGRNQFALFSKDGKVQIFRVP
jgi:tetratricopeptide (TPR) repeat protein